MKWKLGLLSVAVAAMTFGVSADDNTSGVAVPSVPSFPSDAARRGRAIADYADSFDQGWVDQYLQARMTLYDANGDTVRRQIRQMILEGNDGDKSLVRFMTPAEVRGVGALIHEHPDSTDDSWLYLPATRRVRRISGANRTASFQGTEFTYEDLSGTIVRRYDWRFLRETTLRSDGQSAPVYELEARPNYANTGYQRLIFSIHKENWRVEKIQFFDRAGERLKTLTSSRWRQYHGRFWRARRLDMRNHQTGKRTLIESTSQFLNLSLYQRRDGSQRNNLNDQAFTRRALENG
ncbi:MAG: outer membrane lipoprotein-sorting protein [Myxococcota bacterium]